MSMKGKDRAALRAEAHHLSVQVHIGHAGLTPALLACVLLTALGAGELSAKEAARDAAERARAEVIQVIGRTFTLYRENPDLKRGELPPWRG